MAISGVVVTLVEDRELASGALRALSADPRLSLGKPEGCRVPLVADTPSAAEDAALWADLLAMPGVRSADVTFVSVDLPGDAAELNSAGRFE